MEHNKKTSFIFQACVPIQISLDGNNISFDSHSNINILKNHYWKLERNLVQKLPTAGEWLKNRGLRVNKIK